VAEQKLGAADITVNKNMVPFDTQSPFVTSGIRVGTAAVTTRGLKETDCEKVVGWIDTVITNPENDSLIAEIRQEVNTFMAQFSLYEVADATIG
jgi:glycine hydroxymethyltransferase